jgi:hypothetical protein
MEAEKFGRKVADASFTRGRLGNSAAVSDLLARSPQLPSVYFRHTYSGKILQCVQHSLYWLRAAWLRAVRDGSSVAIISKKTHTATPRLCVFPRPGSVFYCPNNIFSI